MREPFGGPGLPPNWSPANKTGVGTSATRESKVWFTLARGIITEVFYPTVDVANTREVQFLVTDGRSFLDEEARDTSHMVEYIDPSALAYRVINTALNGKYRITKSIVTDPARNSLVMKVSFEALAGEVSDYRVYLLHAPHIKNMGYGNSGRIIAHQGRGYLFAWRENVASALTADIPLTRCSVGYVGSSDVRQDLTENLSMDWEFEGAEGGNITLAAELDLSKNTVFTVCLSFGSSLAEAVMEASATMNRRYAAVEKDYTSGWKEYLAGLNDFSGSTFDGGRLFRISVMVLKAHEDKTYGGVIASLSIPWGETKGDKDAGGYHLVWPRDIVNAASAFLALGDTETPKRILRFLLRTQRVDGAWPQNMWLDGRPYWTGVQLDEVALPVILAWRLKKSGELADDYYPMVKRAAGYLVKHGPVTEQDRWEEHSGFSPATLAAEITALVAAAHWAGEKGEKCESEYLFSIADYWSTRLEEWTFAECDCLSRGNKGHFLRIVAEPKEALAPEEEVCHVELFLKNLPRDFPHHQGEVVDPGFLELVRYGLRSPDDIHVKESLEVVDEFLKKELPYGPLFYRYTGDGYGEGDDGEPFKGVGVGRPWPLLAAERGIYEVKDGGDTDSYIRSVEGACNEGGMIPEQVWDHADIPEKGLYLGKGTGSATPLMWAHAEYIKLLRSKTEKACCEIIPEVHRRYVVEKMRLDLMAWKINKPIKWTRSNYTLRIINHRPGTVVWTLDGWNTRGEAPLTDTGLGVYHADFDPGMLRPDSTFTFTFRYDAEGEWEGLDYEIKVI